MIYSEGTVTVAVNPELDASMNVMVERQLRCGNPADDPAGGGIDVLMRGDTVIQAARLGVACSSATCVQPGTELCTQDVASGLLTRIAS